MTTVVGIVDGQDTVERPRALVARRSRGDALFVGYLTAGGAAMLIITSLIGVFLAIRAWPALHEAGFSFLTTQAWEPDSHHFGIAGILFLTVSIALVAIVVGVPIAAGAALYISEYAPRRLQRTLISLVDLMAAVPSVVYGLWGFFFLQPVLLVNGPQGDGLPRWLSTYLSWIPFFKVTGANPSDPLQTGTAYTSSTFVAGLIVALMVIPITCSIMREVFSQAPVGEREAALALGSTRWGMIRAVVLPFGRGGMIGGTMLGLGRALGETIGVYLIASPIYTIQPQILKNGTISVSSLIALRYGDASAFHLSALMAAGLVLFAMTMAVNFVASAVISRSRSGTVSDA